MKKTILFALSAAVLAVAGKSAEASFLTPTVETQLETWLGEGNLDFTNVFTKIGGDGQTSASFHSAVDGKGRTFTLIEVLADTTHVAQVIGGYNPVSWRSDGTFTFNATDAGRTAFLFNLTSGEIQRQKLIAGGPDYGASQTFNHPSFGPTFGAGFDLNVDSSLSSAGTYGYGYGVGIGDAITIAPITYNTVSIGRIEVYTVSAAPPSGAAVPEPASLALLSLGGLGLVAGKLRKRQIAVAV